MVVKLEIPITITNSQFVEWAAAMWGEPNAWDQFPEDWESLIDELKNQLGVHLTKFMEEMPIVMASEERVAEVMIDRLKRGPKVGPNSEEKWARLVDIDTDKRVKLGCARCDYETPWEKPGHGTFECPRCKQRNSWRTA